MSFLQHNADILKRQTLRWPLTGPNWPATSTARERHAIVEAFEATAAEQRARIDAWLPLRTVLEVVSKEVGRKAKESA